METYYFSFGQKHTHPQTHETMRNYYIEITAASEDAARVKMTELYGDRWACQYVTNDFARVYCPGGRYEKIDAT